jgi:flagellar basal-body rod protein FlgF
VINGLYAAAGSMQANSDRLEAIASNLANVSTAGYKKNVPSFSDCLLGAENAANPAAEAAGTGTFELTLAGGAVDLSDGPVRQTGIPTDLALQGPGFFAVENGDGEAYTRNGTFSLDQDGYLVTMNGRRLLGEGGPIQISEGDWSVSDKGEVMQNGGTIGRLKLVNVPAPALQRMGESLFKTSGDPETLDWANTQVKQGCLEQSNASAIGEMVDLIATLRIFEANQRLIQAQDETLSQATSKVGAV